MSKVTRFPDKVVANSITYPKRITIDEVKGTRITGDVTFTNVLDLCLGAIVQNAFHVVELTVADHAKSLDASPARDTTEGRAKKIDAMRKAVTEHLFDQMNAAFTKALGMFAPDIVQHPGLTELAIQKAEDEIITAYLESLPEDEREAATKAAEELMSQSKRKLLQRIEELNTPTMEFVPLTEDQKRADEILRRYERDKDAVTKDALAWAQSIEFPMPRNAGMLNLAPPEPELTEMQQEMLAVLADESQPAWAQTQAKAYLEANPLPCMTPAVEPGDTFSLEVTPTSEELDDCGGICCQCENEVCKKSPAEEAPEPPDMYWQRAILNGEEARVCSVCGYLIPEYEGQVVPTEQEFPSTCPQCHRYVKVPEQLTLLPEEAPVTPAAKILSGLE